jgi:predicted Co/Zn/Cd cation transporter (cation efflux family)
MREIEQRSLNLAKWANLFMGAAGIVAAIGSHASALMLDGLFSGVNFLAAVLAPGLPRPSSKSPTPYDHLVTKSMRPCT